MSKSITNSILESVSSKRLIEMPEDGDSPSGLLGQVIDTMIGLGWNYIGDIDYANDEGGCEFENWSPAGEDLIIDACYGKKDLSDDEKGKNLIEDIVSYCENFDTDEHVEMWLSARDSVRGVPQSARALVDDADDINEMYQEIVKALKKIDHPMNESYLYNWRDDIEDIEATEENDDIWWAVAEHMCETGNNEGYGSDPGEVMSNIINLFKIPKRSRLYKYLLKWYGSEEKLMDNVRDVYETNDAIYFTTGAGYSIFDADLLGGNADGQTEREFEKFVDKEEGLTESLDESAKAPKANLENDSSNPVWITGTVTVGGKKYTVNAKTYLEGSEFGIDEGPVSKLWVADAKGNTIINYDRGWDVEPTEENDKVFEEVMKAVTDFRSKNPYKVEESVTVDEGVKSFEDWKGSPDYWVRVNNNFGVDSETDLETHEVTDEDLKGLYDEYVSAEKEGKAYTQKDLEDLTEGALEPEFSGRKSFYGKAHVTDGDDGSKVLRSYDTDIMKIDSDGNITMLCNTDALTQTTLRHIREFLLQNNMEPLTKRQLFDLINKGNMNESAKILTEAPEDISEEEEEYELVSDVPAAENGETAEEMTDAEYEEEAEDDAKDTFKDDVEEPWYATTPELDELRDILPDLDYRLFLINTDMICVGRLNGPDVEFLTSNNDIIQGEAEVSEENDTAEEVEERAEENGEDSFEYMFIKAPETFEDFLKQVNVVYLSPEMSEEDKEQYAGNEVSHESLMSYLMNELPESAKKDVEEKEEEPQEEEEVKEEPKEDTTKVEIEIPEEPKEEEEKE